MELITSKEKFFRYLNEVRLGLVKTDEELGLLSENFSNTSDPGFKEKEEKYIKYPFLKQRYEALLDKGKVTTINNIERVVNGGNLGNLTYSSNIKPIDWIVSNALAAYAVTEASSTEKTNIVNFLTVYYNPYPPFGQKSTFSDAGYKAIPKNVEIKKWNQDELMDFLSMSYFNSIDYLLKRNGYNPSPDNVFDFILFQRTWKQRFKNEMKSFLDQRNKSKEVYSDDESQIIKTSKWVDQNYGDKEEWEEKSSEEDDIPSNAGEEMEFKEKPSTKKTLSNDEKIAYLATKLNEKDQKFLSAWYKWYRTDTGSSPQETKEKIVDAISSGDEGTLNIFAPADNKAATKKMYDFITKEMGFAPTPDRPNNAAITGMSRMNEKIMKLIKDPEFIQKMGIGDFSLGRISRASLFSGLKEMKDGQMSKSRMLDFLSETSNFFEGDFNSKHNNLNRIIKIKSLSKDLTLDESYSVETKDLDEEIFGYIKDVTNSLNETQMILNELYKVHEAIKFEYPDVSEKIKDLIPPVTEEVERLINKVIEVKREIKPVIYNLKESKKKTEVELEEERLTNPETKEYVKRRENFIGSHIYGEDLGGLGKMYVAYSYGEQFPAYLWYNNKWYHNSDNYILDDGTVNEPTNQHKADMRPSQDTHGMSTYALNTMIRKFKRKHDLGDNVHTDVEPGEKN
jgi:hypothetical protein